MQALLDVFYVSTTLFDGLVAASGGVAMDAVDYTGQRPIDVLNDCAQQSGRNFFVFYDETGAYTPGAGDFGLFYDFSYLPVYPSNDPDFRVSNVLSDCDRTGGEFTGPTWPPSLDAELAVDPMRVVSAAHTMVGKTAVPRQLITTSYKFAHRDMDVATPDLKTVAKAEARLDRYLDDNATEDARLTFRMRLPAANVNDWKEGQYAQVRFSHLKTDALDLSEFTAVRCVRRTVAQDEETDAFYNVDYECTPMRGVPSGGAGAQQVGLAYSGIPELPRPTTPGNVLLAVMFASGNSTKFPTAFRALDNPPVSPASPATPPFSALQTAAWTVIGMRDDRLRGPVHRLVRRAVPRAVPLHRRDEDVGLVRRGRVAARRARGDHHASGAVLDRDHGFSSARLPLGIADLDAARRHLRRVRRQRRRQPVDGYPAHDQRQLLRRDPVGDGGRSQRLPDADRLRVPWCRFDVSRPGRHDPRLARPDEHERPDDRHQQHLPVGLDGQPADRRHCLRPHHGRTFGRHLQPSQLVRHRRPSTGRRDAARHPLPGQPVGMKITPPPTPHRAPTAVGGDLSGSTATPVVSGLGGTPLDTTTPTTGQILAFDGTSWVPTTVSARVAADDEG